MYNNQDILITLSQYLIRPQQRRIFTILCNDSKDSIIAHGANKRIAEYCNSLRRHRDISGKILVINHSKYLYSDIYGYRYKRDKKAIIDYYYRDRMYYFYIGKFNNGNYINAIINNNKVCMDYINDTIYYYSNNGVQYFWHNKELSEIVIDVANSFNILNISLANNTVILRNPINDIDIFNIAI